MNFFYHNFGDFTPTFLGISMNVNSDQFNTLKKFNQNTPIENLLNGKLMLEQKGQEAMEYFSLISCFAHEKKHFYDFFLTPFGNRVFRLQIHSAFHAFQYIAKFRDAAIPIPITKWINFSKEEKVLRGKILKPFLGDLKIFDFENDTYNINLIEAANESQNSIDAIIHFDSFDLLGLKITTKYLLEANAILNQLQVLYNTFGEDEMTLLAKKILKKDTEYSIIIKLLYNNWRHIPLLNVLHIIHVIVSWCLFGDEKQEDDSPMIRFMKVFTYYAKNKPPSSSIPPSELFFSLDKNFSYNNSIENLNYIAKINRNFASKFEKIDTFFFRKRN